MNKFNQKENKRIVSNRTKINLSNKIVVRLLFFLIVLAVFFLIFFEGQRQWRTAWPIESIKLEGDIQFLKKADILSIMKRKRLKGMLAVDLEVLQKLTKQVDWVLSVEIRKAWPNQLVFRIVEHTAVAIIDDYILTENGTRIPLEDGEWWGGKLPVINYYEPELASLSLYQLTWGEFQQLRKLLKALPIEVERLLVDSLNSWKFFFKDGFELNLGRKRRIERVERFIQAYPSIQNKNKIKYVDLRYHNGLAVEWVNKEQLAVRPAMKG